MGGKGDIAYTCLESNVIYGELVAKFKAVLVSFFNFYLFIVQSLIFSPQKCDVLFSDYYFSKPSFLVI